MKKIKLKNSDRQQINLMSEAAYVNPFTEQRWQLDQKILGRKMFQLKTAEAGALDLPINKLVQELARQGISSIEDVVDEDRESLEYLYLFEVFHFYRLKFDGLIKEQIKRGNESVKVAFGNECMEFLQRRGFVEEESIKLLGVFFQIRRAFYFIENDLKGVSQSVHKLRISLWNNIFTYDIRWYNKTLISKMEDFSTMLLGETGTGKGTVAQAIGRSGYIPYDVKKQQFCESFTKIFIPINLSQFSSSLIESELFGHTKGAFTGALEEHPGIFTLSSPHGSIFLDEIGDVSIPIQIKLLKILQEREFTPVGSHQKLRFAGRVIAATNKSIEQLRQDHAFRDDFYYRLCSDIIVVPTLQQRIAEDPEELLLLLKSVLQRMTSDTNPKLVEMVYQAIVKSPGLDYHWPGNVRELEQCIRRILLTKSYHGEYQIDHDLQSRIVNNIQKEGYDARNLLSDYCKLLYERHKSYQEVAQITGLDRRTVKKYLE